ncbi:unnamed protein product, partial [Trichogramma brassicae]
MAGRKHLRKYTCKYERPQMYAPRHQHTRAGSKRQRAHTQMPQHCVRTHGHGNADTRNTIAQGTRKRLEFIGSRAWFLLVSCDSDIGFNRRFARALSEQNGRSTRRSASPGRSLEGLQKKYVKNPLKERRTIGWFKTQLEQLERQWNEFQQGHRNVCKVKAEFAEDPYFKEDVYSVVYMQYSLVKTDIMDALNPGRSQTSLQADAQYQDIGIDTPRYKAPLPTIDLPQFSGDQLEWETFKGMFIVLVHDVPSLPPILKLQYLIRSLTGEAANRLKNVQITAENYDGAWQAILDRYDNKKVLLSTHMSHVISCPAMQKKSIEELRRVLDVIRESKQALDNLKIEPEHMGELWLIHHTVNKLDQATRLDWERQVDETDGFLKYSQLMAFLERSIRVSEAAATTSSGSVGYNSNINNKFTKNAPNRHNKQIAVHTTSAQAASKPGARACVLCRGSHALYSCHKFAALSQPQRFELCKREKLCLNCLSSSHYAGDCRSERRCVVCQGLHHTKLHADSQAHRGSASVEDGGGSARRGSTDRQH